MNEYNEFFSTDVPKETRIIFKGPIACFLARKARFLEKASNDNDKTAKDVDGSFVYKSIVGDTIQKNDEHSAISEDNFSVVYHFHPTNFSKNNIEFEKEAKWLLTKERNAIYTKQKRLAATFNNDGTIDEANVSHRISSHLSSIAKSVHDISAKDKISHPIMH